MQEDISYDFLSLPNNLVEPKQDDYFPTSQDSNISSLNPVPINFNEVAKDENLMRTVIKDENLIRTVIKDENLMRTVIKDENLTRTVIKDDNSSFNSTNNLTPIMFSNPPISSLTNDNIKLIKNTSKGNQSKNVTQPNNYVSQPTQHYRNIQPNPAPLQTTPIHAIKPLTPAQPKIKTGSNVVTVQSVGQIHVPADQMKQVRYF